MTFPVDRSLDGVTALSHLPAETRRQIENACQWRNYPPGKTLLERGETNQSVFFVVFGKVRILNYSTSGRAVMFATLEAGGYFGELAAIDGEPRSATAIAETPCRAALLPAPHFGNLIRTYPDFAFDLVKRLAAVIRASDSQIMDLSSLGASQRVCVELLRLAEADPITPDSWIVYPLPTQANLAGRVGTSRETVAREFSRLSREGIVERKSRTLYIRDRVRLEAFALGV